MSFMRKRQKQKEIKIRRKKRRQTAKIGGTKDRPRLSVFRSNKHIFSQIIDDQEGKTLVAASDKELEKIKKGKIEKAFMVGELIAKKALKKTIEKVVFDRGRYKYHGRVKALADGARKAGLQF